MLQLDRDNMLRELRAHFEGRLITPDDESYDAARAVFYGNVDRRPAAIARPRNATDVSRAVRIAREADVELAIRGGGHSLAGHGVCEDGIVIDLKDMRSMDIDATGRTAWAEAGLTAGDYSSAAGQHGLATGFGDAATVGITGLTLGGGVGYLVRKYGLTIDQLLAAEIVTADGKLAHTDADTHPDLFWAIRGGGGNFGVVTRLQFRLYPVDRIVGGMLMLPASAGVIHEFVRLAEDASEELSVIANVMPAPPMPFVPAEHHGRLVIMGLMAYAGPADAGERALAPFRALASPVVDMVRPMHYPEIYPPEQPGYHPVAAARTLFLDAFDRSHADKIIEHLGEAKDAMHVAQLRVLGGAMARVPSADTAFAHRDRRIMANVAVLYEDPARAAEYDAWTDRFASALRAGGDSAAYVNFLGEADETRVHDAYPGDTWERLTDIKRRYDPGNLFHRNHNIQPTTASAGAPR